MYIEIVRKYSGPDLVGFISKNGLKECIICLYSQEDISFGMTQRKSRIERDKLI